MLNKDATPTSTFKPIRLLDQVVDPFGTPYNRNRRQQMQKMQ